MVLKTPRPKKGKKSGFYYPRVRIPQDLRGAFDGPGEHKESLGTKDPKEAEKRIIEQLRVFRAKCENLRKGPQVISEQEAQRIADPVFLRWLGEYRDNTTCN